MNVDELLIVVPARGGSKGLPKKNARVLGDLPLLGWTAEAVRRSGLRKARCILSTDDAEIAELGEDVGLDVPFMRPAHLADDQATAASVAVHALDWYAGKYGREAEYIMLLQPTSPFRPPAVLDESFAMLNDRRVDGVLGVKPIYRNLRTLFQLSEDGELVSLADMGEAVPRRQDVKASYTPNGSMYLVRSHRLRGGNTFFPPGCRAVVMDQISSHDIDDPLDWAIAEAIVASNLTWRD